MEVQYSFFLLLCTQRVYNLRLYVVYGKIQKERKRKEKVQRMDGQFINKKSACKHKYMAIQFTQTIKEIATFYFHISVGECVSFFLCSMDWMALDVLLDAYVFDSMVQSNV